MWVAVGAGVGAGVGCFFPTLIPTTRAANTARIATNIYVFRCIPTLSLIQLTRFLVEGVFFAMAAIFFQADFFRRVHLIAR